MNQKIKELLEAIMEEAMGIGSGAINTSTSAFGTLPNDVVGRPKPFTKQSNKRQKNGQLNYKYTKAHSRLRRMQDEKGKVQ